MERKNILKEIDSLHKYLKFCLQPDIEYQYAIESLKVFLELQKQVNKFEELNESGYLFKSQKDG